MSEETALKVELEYFESNRQEWLHTHLGEYALVSGDRLLGFFVTWRAGFEFGIKYAGVGTAFLLKQVLAENEVFYIFACINY